MAVKQQLIPPWSLLWWLSPCSFSGTELQHKHTLRHGELHKQWGFSPLSLGSKVAVVWWRSWWQTPSSIQNLRICWNTVQSLPVYLLVGSQNSQLCACHWKIYPADQSTCLAMSCQTRMTVDCIRTWRGCFYHLLHIWKILSIFARISCGRTGKEWGGGEVERCDSSVSLPHFWHLKKKEIFISYSLHNSDKIIIPIIIIIVIIKIWQCVKKGRSEHKCCVLKRYFTSPWTFYSWRLSIFFFGFIPTCNNVGLQTYNPGTFLWFLHAVSKQRGYRRMALPTAQLFTPHSCLGLVFWVTVVILVLAWPLSISWSTVRT